MEVDRNDVTKNHLLFAKCDVIKVVDNEMLFCKGVVGNDVTKS